MHLLTQNKNRNLVEFFAVLVFASLFFLVVVTDRLAANDEGFYLLAAKLVSEGNVPYLDFFYPQMPLYPYLVALFVWPLESIWLGGRMVSGFAAALVAFQLYIFLKVRFARAFAIFGILIFCSSHLIFGWFSVAKPFAVVSLFLVAAYILLDLPRNNRLLLRAFLSGIFACIAVQVRALTCLVLPVLFLMGFWQGRKQGVSYKTGGYFLLGCFIALLPSIYIALADHELFWLNNVEYHQLRDYTGSCLLGPGCEKLETLLQLIGVKSSHKPYGDQFPYLFWLALLYGLASIVFFRRLSAALFMALALFIANLFPPKLYEQYFSIVVPFLIIVVVELFYQLFRLIKKDKGMVFQRNAVCSFYAVVIIFSVLYSYAGLRHYSKYATTRHLLVGSRRAYTFELSNIRELASLIDKQAMESELLYSMWPGFAVDTDMKVVSGLENNFGPKIADELSDKKREEANILTIEEQREQLAREKVKIAVYSKRRFPKKELNRLEEEGFKLIEETDIAYLYQRSE